MEGSQKHDRKRRTSKEKTTYCFIPFLWNFRKGETIGTENRSVDSWGECWVSRGKYQQWWLQERSFYGAGNISVLRVVMFTGLCPVTQFSSDFTLKVGEFHCIQLSLVAMCWTLWKEQEWVQEASWEAEVSPQPPPFKQCPFPIALQLESLTEHTWGTWLVSSSLWYEGSNHHQALATISISGWFPRMSLG